jgi:uncharacterized protein YegP (UPF0339 family)
MSPKIQVYKDVAGKTRFRIRADNNRIVATGEAYEQYASCINGIRSIQKNCLAPVEDLTVEGAPNVPNPKYQIYKDASGEFRFRLKAANGEIIAQGEGYESKEGCLNGIDVLRKCWNAEIEDPYAKKPTLQTPAIEKIETPTPPSSVRVPEVAVPEVKIPEAKPEVEVPVPQVKTEIPEVKAELPTSEVTAEEPKIVTPVLPPEKEETPWLGPVDTVLELYAAPANIAKGDKVAFKGRLFRTNTNRGIPGAKICIWERDRSILGNDYLAFGKTAEDGSFSIDWKARPLAWRKNTGNIFAEFNGNEKAKPSKSAVQTITIT